MLERSILGDMKVALGIAQYIAPMDSGNMRYNAISSERTNDGFRITYSLSKAYYIYFQEEGTRKFIGNQGFIANQTVPAIAAFLSAKYTHQDQKLTNHFLYYARVGSQGFFADTHKNNQIFYDSIFKDVGAMAQQHGWKHEVKMETYQPEFSQRKVTDYVGVR